MPYKNNEQNPFSSGFKQASNGGIKSMDVIYWKYHYFGMFNLDDHTTLKVVFKDNTVFYIDGGWLNRPSHFFKGPAMPPYYEPLLPDPTFKPTKGFWDTFWQNIPPGPTIG